MVPPLAAWKPKSVKFDPNIVETSFGGTQRLSRMKTSASNSSLNSSSGEDTSLSDMDRTFFTDSPQETIAKRKVKSYPFADCAGQENESPYKIMKAALKRSELKEEDSSGVTVAVRVRPFTKRELSEEDVHCVVSMQDDETTVTMDNGQKLSFTYDHSLWSFDDKSPFYADQQYTYEAIARPLLVKAMKGYNACLFAYGQTSSGKSHSIMGSEDEPGIIPRFSEELFNQIRILRAEEVRVNVEMSFFEIYNEKINDLLTTNSDGKLTKRLNLKVREHPVTGPYVEGLCVHVIDSYEDLENWLSLGNKQRATAATGMNEKSSRSHSVFTINLSQTKTENLDGEIHEHALTSKINLIDLAGSERQSSAKTTGDRLKEGASINRSLLTLGKVISQLCDLGTSVDTKKRKVFIPYRDSVLTWLLKESLGGNSQTSMLATVSPANICLDETVSTLRYASQARYIVNSARINEDPKARLIRELRAEIDKLRSMMTGSLTDDDMHASSIAEIATLKSRLSEKEYAMMQMTKSWEERLKASEEKMKEETKYLEKSGIALKMNKNLPFLVNLNEDPQLSETLVYVLQPGLTKVGQASQSDEMDIQLSGALIAPEHCLIHNDDGTVAIEPVLEAMTYVNGNHVEGVTELQHGDRVILGGDHYFRYHHPQTHTPSRSRTASGNSVKDFHFAKEELIQVQNAKMEAELAEVRRTTKLEMERQKAELEKEAKLKLDQCLEETKRLADEQLNMQKQDYEVKLKEMNEKLDLKSIDSKLAEEVERQASHLRKENEHLQNEVEIYKKKIVSEDLCSPQAEDDILSEIEAIKNQMNDECNRWSELRQSARKSVLTPGRRRQTPYRPRTPRHETSQRDTSPDLTLNKSTPDQRTPNHVEENEEEDEMQTTSVFQLYEVALMIREANKISEFLSKATTFHREVIDEGSVCVRVSKPSLGISTFWSVAKLSDRLLRMREMYEGLDSEGQDPFYDTTDTWEQDDRISSPALLHKRLKAIRRSLSPKIVVTKRLSFSEEQLSPLVLGEMQTPPTKCEKSVELTMELCQNLLHEVMANYKEQDRTLVDMVLLDLQKLLSLLKAVVLEGIDSVAMADVVLKLVTAFQSLSLHCQYWQQPKSGPIIHIYADKLTDLMQKFHDQMALLLQGCQSDISSMIQQSSGKLEQILYRIAKLSGEFSLASQREVNVCFSDEDKLSKTLLTGFLSGSDLFVDKTLKGAIGNVEESELRIQTLRDSPNTNADFDIVYEQIEVLVASVRVLLSTIQETQVTMETVSLKRELDLAYYGNNYKRLTGQVVEISSLSEQVRLLAQTAQAIAAGKEQEVERVERCCETVDRVTGRLVVQCTSVDLDAEGALEEMDTAGEGRVHAAAHEIRLSVQHVTRTVRRLVRTHPHLTLSSPRAGPWSPRRH